MNSPHPQGSQLTSQLWYSSQFSSPALLASVTGCLGPYLRFTSSQLPMHQLGLLFFLPRQEAVSAEAWQLPGTV